MTALSRAAAVVLAAGLGTRFGEAPKLIAPLAGKPVLQHVLDTLHEADIGPIVVVLGHAAADVRKEISWREEVVITNSHPQRGILRSVLLGLRRLDQIWSVPERTVVALGDQPRLGVEQIQALLAASVDEDRPFVVPRYIDGQPGNPVLLEASGREIAEQFVVHTRKDTDRGLSQLFTKLPERTRYVDVPGMNPDVDTPEDLAVLEAKLVVSTGYDSLAGAYGDWSKRVVDPARERLITELMDRLPEGAELLDLGCGPGLPTTRQLAERFAVTGVDSSKAQLELARANVPGAKFIEADMASLTFPEASFDAVTAFYSLTHVPRPQVPALLSRIARWLRPGGLLLATFSSADDPGWMGEWLGQPMFFSGYDTSTNRRLLADAEFEVLIDHDVEIVEPEGPARFLWILAQSRPAQSGTT